MTPTKASASDFFPSVILAVAAASADTKNAVHWDAVLPAWKSLTGLDESSFGKDKRGYPRVLTAISTAWSSAKKKGHAAPSPRRTYCLTDKGLEYARSNVFIGMAKPSVEVTPEPGDIVEVGPVEIDPPVPPVTDRPPAGVRFDPASKFTADNGDPIYEDTYFRSLAIDSTRCFGRFSPRATATCGKCPLAKWCASAVVANMAIVAASLDAPVEVTPEPVAETPAPAAPPVVGATCTIEFESPCEGCGEILPEGSAAIHVPRKGVYHVHCASEA